MESVDQHHQRITRAEDDIDGLKSNMIRLEVQMKGFGDILSRIEVGIRDAQNDLHSKRINPIALATVLISMLTFMIGGAWLISGQLSRTDVRLTDQQATITQLVAMRDRELDGVQHRIDRLDDRGGHGGEAVKAPD